MDIAKHAVRTVIQSMASTDRLSLVTFAGTSKVVLPLTDMDEAGKAKAESALQDVGFDSDTMLWTGLSAGLESLRVPNTDGSSRSRLSHMMLLTDGEAKDKAS